MNKRFRNSIKRAKTYPGADINSNHIPVIATISLKLKKAVKAKSSGLYDTDLLGEKKRLTDQFNVEVQNRFSSLQTEDVSAEEHWKYYPTF